MDYLRDLLIAASKFVTGPLQEHRVKRLGERQLLSMDDLCSRFYSGGNLPMERILDVLKDLSEALEIPAGKLRPSDRFLVEFAPLKNTWRSIGDTEFSLMLFTKYVVNKYAF